jgi:hypothetical protein
MCVRFAMEPSKVQVELNLWVKHVENHFTRCREGVCVCVKDIIELS